VGGVLKECPFTKDQLANLGQLHIECIGQQIQFRVLSRGLYR